MHVALPSSPSFPQALFLIAGFGRQLRPLAAGFAVQRNAVDRQVPFADCDRGKAGQGIFPIGLNTIHADDRDLVAT